MTAGQGPRNRSNHKHAAGRPPVTGGQTARKDRLSGVDAARGVALLAMIAIHILPAWNDEFAPTLVWSAFAGRGVALFALLAGLSLALSSGGARRLDGDRLSAARAGIAVRAAIILGIGLLLGYLDIMAQVILAYYGVMFLLALPLLRLSARALTVLAAAVALVFPFIMQGLRDYLPEPPPGQPTLTGLFTDFGAQVPQLLLTGTYPALPWMAYICAGLAIGRLDLRSRKVQSGLLASGCGLALLTTLVSAFLLGPAGGRNALEELNGGGSTGAEAVYDILVWGPDPTLPTDSWWWLAGLAPYSSTPVVILNTIGLSAALLALLLLVGPRIERFLAPLAAMGTMTLTLYSAHLLLLATGLLTGLPWLALLLHIGLAAAFALLWRPRMGQGPLERLVSAAVSRVRAAVLSRKQHRSGDTLPSPQEEPVPPRLRNRGSRHRAGLQDTDPPGQHR
ncbi:heparan-alpha-glucosaminide N-acetyltransferase domain-containing protein [Arthrobacter sp. zg-Y324]|nr:heparan-alpha-glucosaminide N-acetyltransferase domain-containing protein [Arthrobacter caoxuetaonis]MCC3283286.1 heparan-alpha-glucosaminide N-acetyltransferase domain-containing protein [Arthrobacter caoxuetaonis]